MHGLEFRLVRRGQGAAPGAGAPGRCAISVAQGERRVRRNDGEMFLVQGSRRANV